RGDRHRTCIGPAAPKRDDAATLLVKALEAGDHRHLTQGGKTIEDRRSANLLNAPRTVLVRGKYRSLPALPRTRRDSLCLQDDREETGGHLLARGDNGVIFAP